MRFEVPQFIEIEDKIFGPFTWRQFIYLAGGVGFAIVLFFIAHIFIFILIGLPIAVLAVALAFYQVNNRPFERFLESMLGYFTRTRLYLWKKTGTGIYNGSNETKHKGGTATAAQTPSGNGGLHSLSRKLELNAIQKQQ